MVSLQLRTDVLPQMVTNPLTVFVNYHTVTLASRLPRGTTMLNGLNMQLMCCELVCSPTAGSLVKADPWKHCSGLNCQALAGYYPCTTTI